MFAELGPRRGDLVLDAGARDAKHAIRLVREHGVRAIALDPVPMHCALARERIAEAGLTDEIDVVEGAIEELPFDEASFDWIWCRDVLVHVDLERGLAECARVLRPGGVLLAYVTLATDRLEPLEADELVRCLALQRSSLDPAHLETAAEEAGLALRSVERLGSEWRERLLEDADWDVSQDLREARAPAPARAATRRALRGAGDRCRCRRARLGRLPAAREALPNGLRLGAPCVTASRPPSST